MPAAFAREDLEDGPRPPEAAFGGLVRIGRGADGNGVLAVDTRELLAKEGAEGKEDAEDKK